jgi:hypothetical protein
MVNRIMVLALSQMCLRLWLEACELNKQDGRSTLTNHGRD